MTLDSKERRHPALETKGIRDALGKHVVQGAKIIVVAQVLRAVILGASMVVLARVLKPSDFGLIAMVMVVTGLMNKLKDAGLSAATIQDEDITHEQVSTLFWFNTAQGIVLGLILAVLAPVLVSMYRQTELFWITIALAFVFPLGGVQVQHEALIRRQMKFKALALLELAAVFLGSVLAIVLAFMGMAYWALVCQALGAAFVSCVLSMLYSGWRPSRPAWGRGSGRLLGFGGKVAAASVINYVGSTIDDLLIGRQFGDRALGLVVVSAT